MHPTLWRGHNHRRRTGNPGERSVIDADNFIARWKASGGAERSNYQLFLSELCDVLGVPRPDPAVDDNTRNHYVFDHAITFQEADGKTTTKFIDLYKKGCFVLETKQGVENPHTAAEQRSSGFQPERLKSLRQDAVATILSEAGKKAEKKKKKGHGVRGTAAWHLAMKAAHGQAEGYARGVPASDGRPPFVVVVDVGHSIELFSEFTRTGGSYVAFPDPQNHRIPIDKLTDPAVRETLRALWTDPMSLDPSRRSAKVTREIADKLAKLAKALEADGHAAKDVAEFLMRCLFTMFAEDVHLLPKAGFTSLLEGLREKPEGFKPTVVQLWKTMNDGGFSPLLRETILRFNGGLFKGQHALDLTADQLQLLIEAAKADWREVEPAIFGTLLERALNPRERHKLGAHYTPRAYVERLVVPTIVEPLREEWSAAQAAAIVHMDNGDSKKARKELEAFHERLCAVRILDPACGSGNFLYVALEHLKRIEGEVLDLMSAVEGGQSVSDIHGRTVDPHQLLGIEINPRAAVIAELVLWIGYLQWHHRIRGEVNPPEPVIKDFKNIECRDAILAYDAKRMVLDPETNTPKTRWDGRTTKPHPVTGEEVPDDSARELIYEYVNPRKAEWPEADYVVGNPPFIGNKRMRIALDDGYVDALRATYKAVPESADLVMYWWYLAGNTVINQRTSQFGLITTNSLRQIFNRRVIEAYAKQGGHIRFAIPDHPWVDSTDGAAVRVSMTVGTSAGATGILSDVIDEWELPDQQHSEVRFSSRYGIVNPNLTLGVDVASTAKLAANGGLSSRGCALVGDGFLVNKETLASLGLGRRAGVERVIRQFRSGSDITQICRNLSVIDLFGLDEHTVRRDFPEIYQRLAISVKVTREAKRGRNRDADEYADRWWLFAKPRPELRKALRNCKRFIATSEVSKHRIFVFIEYPDCLIEGGVIAIALQDAHHIGILSSRIHVAWALAQGGTLEDRPRYNNSRCFDPFPFPDATDAQKARIRELGERLDAHRKARQAEHPALTMTGMYNVLEKLRSIERTSGFQPEKLTLRQDAVGTFSGFSGDAVRKRVGKFLPHWTHEDATYFVTFRLADSVPMGFADQCRDERRRLLAEAAKAEGKERETLLRRAANVVTGKFDALLDEGRGAAYFDDPEAARMVSDALEHFDGERYRLWAYCVMPNHVHVVVQPLGGHKLEDILHSWKSYTANAVNKHLRRSGALWQEEYFDHLVRSQEGLEHFIAYTLENPVKAGLTNCRTSGFQPEKLTLRQDAVGTEQQRTSGFQPEKLTLRQDAVGTEQQRTSGFQPESLILRQDAVGTVLTAKEKEIHEQGLISVLKEIHDELDRAVFDAYGWPSNLADEEILERLVALNLERAEEEKRGLIRWLRPEYQNPQGDAPTQTETEMDDDGPAAQTAPSKTKKLPWPAAMAARAKAVREVLAAMNGPATVDAVAATFARANKSTVEELLDTLAELGQCRLTEDGRYVAQ